MVIQSLFNHNFLTKPEECDIMADISSKSRKIISVEVEQNLSFRLMNSLPVDETLKKGPLNLPMLLEPEGAVDWKLPTWQHVKWTLHSLAPVFSLSLDSLPSINNAVKIYCMWLKTPRHRPPCVTSDKEYEFVTTILMDLSELFVARKLSDNKSVSVASCKRHSELCNVVIRTIMNHFVPESPLLKQKASPAWSLLTSLILGITDDLLWRDDQNYLADDLSESLLLSCFTCLMKSNIYSEALWKKVNECFRLWCHRVKAVLVWNSVVVPATKAVSAVLYSNDAEELQPVSIGVHSIIEIPMEKEFLVFCWSKFSKLLPKLSSMTCDVYLRSAQTTEKIVDIWLACPSIPDINTLLTLYGDYIFDACSTEKAGFDSGRAIILTSLCKLLSLPQSRVSVEDKYLSIAYMCLQRALADNGIVLDAVLVNIESVLMSNQSGARCLLPFILDACRRTVKRYVSSKASVPAHIRMCCYRLLNILGLYFISDLVSLDTSIKKSQSMNGLYSEKILSPSELPAEYVFRMVVDVLVTATNVEDSMANVRFLLNAVMSLVRLDQALVPVFAKILEECLYLERWSVETLFTAVRCLEQLAKYNQVPLDLSKRICLSLMTLTESLATRAQLSQSYFLIIAIYEAAFAWLNSFEHYDFDSVTTTLSTLTKLMPTITKVSERSKVAPSSEGGNSIGGHSRKSLASRIFTSDIKDEKSRPVSLSPGTQKTVEDIMLEVTNSMIQRVLVLLFDGFSQDGDLSALEDAEEFSTTSNFQYFALSSSVIIGCSEDVIVMRNPVKRFSWKVNFVYSDDPVSSPTGAVTAIIKDAVTKIALEPEQKISVFDRELVVEGVPPLNDDVMLLLNDDHWKRSLQDNSDNCEQMLAILDEARSNAAKLVSKGPQTALHISSQLPYIDSARRIRSSTLLAHLGLCIPAIRAVLMPLPNSPDLEIDLKRLDCIACKQEVTIPIEYLLEQSNSSTTCVSQSFADFVNGLGCAVENDPLLRTCIDHSVHVNFCVSALCNDAPVQVIWSENGEAVSRLPESLSPDSSAFVYLVIAPVLVSDNVKGHFYQIRILLPKSAPAESETFQKYTNIFGPLYDGIIVPKGELSSLVAETAISAHLFILRFILNKPNPVADRASCIRSIVFKYFQNLPLREFYAKFLEE